MLRRLLIGTTVFISISTALLLIVVSPLGILAAALIGQTTGWYRIEDHMCTLPDHDCHKPELQCEDQGVRIMLHKAELPDGAEEASHLQLAEAGAPFRATDVLTPHNRDLPYRRFIKADAEGCKLMIVYEEGGRAHSYNTRMLFYEQGQWTLH